MPTYAIVKDVRDHHMARSEERTVAYIVADGDEQAKRLAEIAFPDRSVRISLADTPLRDQPSDEQ